MYREKQYPAFLNVLFDNGGAGDLVSWLPPLKFILTNHKHVQLNVWMPEYFVEFATKALKEFNKNLTIRKLNKDGTPSSFNRNHPTISFKMTPYSNLGAHMTEHAFEIICHTKPENKEHFNYIKIDTTRTDISRFYLPDNYVVVTTGFTAPVREFLPEYVNEISRYITSKGLVPVFLGKKATNTGINHVIQGNFNNDIDFSLGKDLIDQTSLFECVKICGNAKAVIGLDNGILHLAGCTDVPIVGGFTTVNPNHRMPYRNGVMGWNYFPVVPPESLACRFCQSNWQFSNGVEFTKCFYQDYKCTKELSANLYIEQLEKILK